jgi:hypothetical protein
MGLQEWRARNLKYYKLITRWMPIKMTSEEFIDNRYSATTKNIAKISGSCRAAREVLSGYNEKEDIYRYLKEHHSSIGTDIYHNDGGRCTAFLVGYYDWLANEYKDLPEIPLPDNGLPLPDIGGDIKKSAQVTGLVVMGFVALLVYLMFRGGAGRDLTVVT